MGPAAVIGALLTPATSVALGEVISSWQLSGTTAPYALGIVRDDTYVYGVFYHEANVGSLRRFTTTGSFLDSVPLTVSGTVRDGDSCDLGAAYCVVISIVAGTSGRVYKVVKSTGSIANSFSVTTSASNPQNIAYIANIGYYAVGGGYTGTTINMYTTLGMSAGTWTISSGQTYMGALAWSSTVNWMSGSYVIYSAWSAGIGHTVFTYPGATVVGGANWGAISGGYANGSCCGPGAPGTIYTQFWANMYTGSGLYCFQYMLQPHMEISPASLGRIRAQYR